MVLDTTTTILMFWILYTFFIVDFASYVSIRGFLFQYRACTPMGEINPVIAILHWSPLLTRSCSIRVTYFRIPSPLYMSMLA